MKSEQQIRERIQQCQERALEATRGKRHYEAAHRVGDILLLYWVLRDDPPSEPGKEKL